MRKLPPASIQNDAILANERLSVSFHRTLRIPDDGKSYPLPPGLGRFPLRRARDYPARLPSEWHNDLFLPIYAREALWIGFEGADWKPNAVKIAAGGVNVVTGDPWNERLHGDPQDYIVCPDQPWIDGIKSGKGTVRQFVMMPLGGGYTIEAQVTGIERIGGLQFAVFEPEKGRFPDRPPVESKRSPFAVAGAVSSSVLGVAVGGVMQQKIYPDRFGIDTWDANNRRSLRVHFLSPAEFSAVTGEPLPPTPVDAHAYTEAGLPWFELYDEPEGDLEPAEALKRLRSLRDLEKREAEPSIRVRPAQVKRVRGKS